MKRNLKKEIVMLLIFSLNLLWNYPANGQTNETKSRIYYIEAKKSYTNSQYDDALSKLNLSEKIGGASNAYIEALRAKTYAAKEEWEKAQKALDKCFGFNPNNKILSEISSTTIKVEEEMKRLEEKRKKALIAKREAERKRLEKQRKEEEARRKRAQKTKALAKKMKPEIWAAYNKFKSLRNGRPYLITYRKKLTSSDQEQTFMIFYENKYIAYTIPSVTIAEKLNKEKVEFGPVNVLAFLRGSSNNIATIKRGSSKNMKFKKGIHYSNIFLGGYGDELLWTEGSQYHQFDQDLYYYYYYNSLHCDVKLNKSRSDHYYNPYIETGKIELTVDYRIIKDEKLENQLNQLGVKNKKGSLENPPGLQIKMIPDDNLKMLYTIKKIKYKLHEKVKADIVSNNRKFKGNVLYFKPLNIDRHYGFIQYNTNYPERNIFEAITGFSSDYRMSRALFDSIYKAFSNDVGGGTTRYFTSKNYKSFFEDISKMAKGSKESINYNITYIGD